jgi:hypothetical protein
MDKAERLIRDGDVYGFMFENSSSEPEVEAEDVISVEENQGEENED